MGEVRKDWVAKIMGDWVTFTDNVTEMTLEEVLFAMELENEKAEPRKTFMRRLNQRYNGIREAEIRKELDG
jgi:hypothetical protein